MNNWPPEQSMFAAGNKPSGPSAPDATISRLREALLKASDSLRYMATMAKTEHARLCAVAAAERAYTEATK